jgi:hypothetical protein
MDKDLKDKIESPADDERSAENESRREFFSGLGKWSKVVIGTALLGGLAVSGDADAMWRNHWGNGGWHNGGWRNKWHNGGWWNGGWRNKWHNGGWWNGGWYNGGGWYNYYKK